MDFLVDAQLPPLLSNWIENVSGHSARHVIELGKGLTSTDTEIWETALKSGEVIISKDFDFYDRAFIAKKSPVILHLNLGNCTNRELIKYFNQNWNTIDNLFHKGHKLISCKFEVIEYW